MMQNMTEYRVHYLQPCYAYCLVFNFYASVFYFSGSSGHTRMELELHKDYLKGEVDWQN